MKLPKPAAPLLLDNGKLLWAGHTWKPERLEAFFKQTCSKPFKGYVVGLGRCTLVAGTLLLEDKQMAISLKHLSSQCDQAFPPVKKITDK